MDTLHRRLVDAMRPEIEREGLLPCADPEVLAQIAHDGARMALDDVSSVTRPSWVAIVLAGVEPLWLSLDVLETVRDGGPRTLWVLSWRRGDGEGAPMITRGSSSAQLAETLASLIVATMED